MDLDALADFNLVAAHGGFGRASRSSGRSKATLSRKVMGLEESLGVRLIERGSQRLRLTEEGRALHQNTLQLLAQIEEVGEALALGAVMPRGLLRISAPIVFAHVALPRIAARFMEAYPEVQLEIVAEDRMVDPVDDRYDLVIRINPSASEHLVGRRFLNDERVIVAPPGMQKPTSRVQGETCDVSAVLLSSATGGTTWSMALGEKSIAVLKPIPVLRFSSLLMIRNAVLAGCGAALLPKLLVEDDIKAGRLVYWGTHAGPPVEVWALQSSRRLASAKVRAFLKVLETEFPDRTFIPKP